MKGSRAKKLGAALILVTSAVLTAPVPSLAASRACPDSIESAGFLDLTGMPQTTRSAIDCLAHYGISTGVTPSTFGPLMEVPRWQMAIFIVRTAQALGQTLPDGGGGQFSDIGGLDQATQRSIRQVAQLGIATGIGTDLFAPFDVVPRWQMALFLSRILTKVGVAMPSSSTTAFLDLAGLPMEATTAIGQLVALGVAAGTSSTSFSPNLPVSRWQMALFLTRTLDVGGARYVRLTISLSSLTVPVVGSTIITVLATKPNGKPYPGLLVDVFVTNGLAVDGTCVVDIDAKLNGGDGATSSDCRIDRADPRTNSKGEVRLGLAHSAVAETETIWAWVGAEGQVFDADVVVNKVSATVSWSATADGLVMSPDVTAAFASNVTVTAQLTGPAAATANQLVIFQVRRGGLVVSTQTRTTDSSGSAQLVYTGPADPSQGNDEPIADTVKAFWDRNGNGVRDGEAEFDGTTIVTWDEP